MRFIDSHCHLHDERIASEIDSIIQRAADSGVASMVSCATMESNFARTAMLAETNPSVIPCFGIHPWFIDTVSKTWQQTLISFLEKHRAGVGETGMDFTDRTSDRDKQLEIFEFHLALAQEMNRPINIHIRKAWDAFIQLIKRFGKLKTPGVIHSYSGSADMIPVLERHGLYLSFSGAITHPTAKKSVKAFAEVSKDRFVFETDTPDIPPYLSGQSRSERFKQLNEPANLPAIAKIAAKRVKWAYNGCCRQAYENSLQVFNTILK